MYAIIQEGAQQYKIRKGDTLEINRREETPSSEIIFNKIIFYSSNDDECIIGAPYVQKVKVIAKAIDHIRGKKVIVYKKKRRKGYTRKNGHRQALTRIEILDIVTE